MSDVSQDRPIGEDGDQVTAYEPPVVEDIDTTHGPAVTAAAAAGVIAIPSGGVPPAPAAPRQL